MPVHPLTDKQREWLSHAKAAGYAGFMAWPSSTLLRLEKHGFIVRDPSTSGKNTMWRITERGDRYLAGYEDEGASKLS